MGVRRSHQQPGLVAAYRAAAALVVLAPAAGLAKTVGDAASGDLAVKAAYLTKFPAYVAWPAGAGPRPGGPVQICLVGGDPFGRLIDEAASRRQIDGHPLQVRRLGAAAEAAGCHVAYVHGGLPQGLEGRPMLTVTDARAGAQRGMIHFVVDRGRVRFDIDRTQAAKSGVGISSRLLSLALSVRQRP